MKDFMNKELGELAKRYLKLKKEFEIETSIDPSHKININKAFDQIDEMKRIANEICLKLL